MSLPTNHLECTRPILETPDFKDSEQARPMKPYCELSSERILPPHCLHERFLNRSPGITSIRIVWSTYRFPGSIPTDSISSPVSLTKLPPEFLGILMFESHWCTPMTRCRFPLLHCGPHGSQKKNKSKVRVTQAAHTTTTTTITRATKNLQRRKSPLRGRDAVKKA